MIIEKKNRRQNLQYYDTFAIKNVIYNYKFDISYTSLEDIR